MKFKSFFGSISTDRYNLQILFRIILCEQHNMDSLFECVMGLLSASAWPSTEEAKTMRGSPSDPYLSLDDYWSPETRIHSAESKIKFEPKYDEIFFENHLLASPKASSLQEPPLSPREIPDLIEVPFILPDLTSKITYTQEKNKLTFFLIINSTIRKIKNLYRTTKTYHFTNGTSWHSFMLSDKKSFVRIMDRTTIKGKYITDVLVADLDTEKIVLILKIPINNVTAYARYDEFLANLARIDADPLTRIMSISTDDKPIVFSVGFFSTDT